MNDIEKLRNSSEELRNALIENIKGTLKTEYTEDTCTETITDSNGKILKKTVTITRNYLIEDDIKKYKKELAKLKK